MLYDPTTYQGIKGGTKFTEQDYKIKKIKSATHINNKSSVPRGDERLKKNSSQRITNIPQQQIEGKENKGMKENSQKKSTSRLFSTSRKKIDITQQNTQISLKDIIKSMPSYQNQSQSRFMVSPQKKGILEQQTIIQYMSLANIYKFFFKPTIPIINITGYISPKLVNEIESQLIKIGKKRGTEGVAVVINSSGGCPYSVDQLQYKIKNYSSGKPIYTFITEQALAGAYKLSTIGISYAQPTSQIGLTSQQLNHIQYDQYLKNHGIRINHLYTSDQLTLIQKQDLNSSEIIKQQQIYYSNQLTKDSILNRKEQVKISQTDLLSQIYFGQEAKVNGLVDNIGTYQDVLLKQFPDAKLVHVKKIHDFSTQIEDKVFYLKLLKSPIQVILVFAFLLKTFIKYSLIIYFILKAKGSKNKEKK
ncbi:hypothetical protein pb186bvf_010697 [Paramecium bursaria]